MMNRRDDLYWHGGAPGLNPGDRVIPGHPNYVDGCPTCEANRAGLDAPGEPLPRHPDKIYMTHDRLYARFYASKYPHGDMYSVEPLGEVSDSAEDPFPTFLCARARVVRVYDRDIMLTMKERRSLYRRWRKVDRAKGHTATFPDEHMFREFIGLDRSLRPPSISPRHLPIRLR